MKLAPIALFTYKKVVPLKRTILALQQNDLAINSVLFIFSDGPKNDQDLTQVEDVRTVLKDIKGFKEIIVKEQQKNIGLANSVIDGVTEILKNYDSVIVLEDDLITSTNFLDFMNQALEFYQNQPNVLSISGFSFPMPKLKNHNYNNYFTLRASSWGWATWKNRWLKVDWDISEYTSFSKDYKAKLKFNAMGSDLTQMLSKQMKGNIDSWAIRWCYHQFKHNLYTVFPVSSMVENIGFGKMATNTVVQGTRYKTDIDTSNKTEFIFDPTVSLDQRVINRFVSFYSIKTRLKYKIRSILGV